MRVVLGKNKFTFRWHDALVVNYQWQIIIMRLLLDLCFSKYVIGAFTHSNYRYAFSCEFNPLLYCISWLILLPSIFLTEEWFRSTSPSKTVLQFIYIIQFVPFTTMLGWSCFPIWFSIYTLLYWIMIGFFSRILLKPSDSNRHNLDDSDKGAPPVFEMVIVLISTLTVLYFGIASGFRINLNILNAYDLRDNARSFAGVRGATYLLGLSRILIPTGLVYSIRKRKTWMIMLFIVFAILDYSFDGSKALYFTSIVAILAALFYSKKFGKYMPLFLNLFLVVGFLESLFNPLPYIYRLVVRRLFFVPNVINNSYFDYMLTHSPNMFSNLLRFMGIKTSYDASFVIGAEYFHSPNMSANTGTIGDALWQFKYVGFLVLPILIVLLLKFFDYSTRDIPFEMLIIPCIVFAYYLNNSSFTAACFSHGLVLFCIVMRTYRRRSSSRKWIPDAYCTEDQS